MIPPIFKPESSVLNFKLLGSQEWSKLKQKDYSIKRGDNVRQIWFRNRPFGCITCYLHLDAIDRLIKRLGYD